MEVNSLNEAQIWFMTNHYGSVLCINDNHSKECNCYPEAVEFYRSSGKSNEPTP